MNRGDFRERLKNYTEEPLDSDWSKMAQLLDINEKKKRRRPFFWKILAGAMLIGALVGGALFFTFKSSPVILPEAEIQESAIIADETEVQEENKINPVTSNIIPREKITQELSDRDVQTSEIKSKIQDKKIKNASTKKAQQNAPLATEAPMNETTIFNSPREVKNNKEQNPVDDSATQIKSSVSPIAFTDEEDKGVKSKDNKDAILSLTNLTSLPLNTIEFQNQRAEEELSLQFSQKPEVKIYKTTSNYLALGLTASFPNVGLGDSREPFLIPNQSLIPNLGIEVGAGRKWSSGMSLELGARTSYFQYRLSNLLSARSPAGGFAEADLFDVNDNREAARINRHMIISPYLRIAYDWDILKSSFIGLFAAVGPNFVFDLPSTNVEGLGNLELDTNVANPTESITAFDITKSETSYECEFGITLGQKVLQTSKVTFNFSYGLTMGNLLSGTVFLEQNNESLDSDIYQVSANGPRFKMRYIF